MDENNERNPVDTILARPRQQTEDLLDEIIDLLEMLVVRVQRLERVVQSNQRKSESTR